MTEFRVLPTGRPRPLHLIEYRDVWSATDVEFDDPTAPTPEAPEDEPVPTEGTPEDGVPAALFAPEDPTAETAAGTEPTDG